MWKIKVATSCITTHFIPMLSNFLFPCRLRVEDLVQIWMVVRVSEDYSFYNGKEKKKKTSVSRSHALSAPCTSHEYFNKPQTSRIIHSLLSLSPPLVSSIFTTLRGHGIVPFVPRPWNLRSRLLSHSPHYSRTVFLPPPAILSSSSSSRHVWLRILQDFPTLAVPAPCCTTAVGDKRKSKPRWGKKAVFMFVN